MVNSPKLLAPSANGLTTTAPRTCTSMSSYCSPFAAVAISPVFTTTGAGMALFRELSLYAVGVLMRVWLNCSCTGPVMVMLSPRLGLLIESRTHKPLHSALPS